MKTGSATSPALRALLVNFIDYAGLFPPAALPLTQTVDNFRRYQNSDCSWMLRWLVMPAAKLGELSPDLDGSLSIVGESEENRAATVESKSVIDAARPVYCEVALQPLDSLGERLDQVKGGGCYAKIRSGGLTPDAIPTPSQVAAFINGCAERKLPFKATAGLHHPIRAMQSLTYEKDAPRAVMHGFINFLMASALAWQGERDIEPVIAEMDSTTFAFDKGARWREKTLTVSQIEDARANFMHSVGSCSFDEPVDDLGALGWL